MPLKEAAMSLNRICALTIPALMIATVVAAMEGPLRRRRRQADAVGQAAGQHPDAGVLLCSKPGLRARLAVADAGLTETHS